MRHDLNILIISIFCVIVSVKASYYLDVNSTGSAVVGSTINFTATLYDDGKVANNGNYLYHWSDNAKPGHSKDLYTDLPHSSWSVEYSHDMKTKPGNYRMLVRVERKYVIWFQIAENHADFELTDSLSGEMLLLQNGLKVKKQYVAANAPVNHTISLRDNDLEYLTRNATSIQTYWFRNCSYLGVSNGLSYEAIYEKEEEIYEIEALVVASFEKLPEPTTTTTTTTTTTSTTTTTTTTTPQPTTTSTTPTTTTSKPNSTTTIAPAPNNSSRNKRDTDKMLEEAVHRTAHANAALLGVNITGNLTSISAPVPQINVTKKVTVKDITKFLRSGSEADPDPPTPFNCIDKSIIAKDYKKAYGYFRHQVVSKLPITNFTANGKNWLQHGDLLNLEIKCKGSNRLQLCTLVFNAPYNATGNETCSRFFTLDECEYRYNRYFSDSKTVLFFIRNDVSETVNQVTINIYEAKKQSQLSVVVVPVSFTLIAVILVVFGVAYYVQSQNRFTVEVADFNFGDTQSVDMEYKTFQQRLIDSIREVFPSRRIFADSNSEIISEPGSPGGGGVDSNIRYNNMS